MKTLTVLCIAALAAGTATAQTTPPPDYDRGDNLPAMGTQEFTIGGGGTANKDVDDSMGGIDFSYGRYFTNTTEWVVRQSVDYANPSNGDSQWFGSTRLALDQNFGRGHFRPFVGVNAGGIYGDAVHDSWAAGLEGGAKFYVRPRTFIQVLVEYAWLFDKGDQIDDRFDDGQWNWGVGVGFNF